MTDSEINVKGGKPSSLKHVALFPRVRFYDIVLKIEYTNKNHQGQSQFNEKLDFFILPKLVRKPYESLLSSFVF